MPKIQVKRVYDPSAKTDGYRILVDRLWPRGVDKTAGNIDLWLKEIAPSSQLRAWFKHDRSKWAEFKLRYFKELATKKDLINTIWSAAHRTPVTLLFAAKDVEYNNAVALSEYIKKHFS